MKVSSKNYAVALYETVKENKGENLKLALKNFVKLLGKKNSLSLAPKIITDFNRYYNEAERIIEIKIASALELSEAEKKEIKNHFEIMTDKKAEVTTEIDPQLIGGVKITFDDRLIDGSLKTKLENLKKQLLVKN